METTNKKLADRITKGEFGWSYDNAFTKDESCVIAIDSQNTKADAELIAEAFNVTNETGLSPRELKEQRDEAVLLLEHIYIYAKLTNETRDRMNDYLNKVKQLA